MSKQSSPRRVADDEARAVLKNVRISPQKLNLVAGLIRGHHVSRALEMLQFSRKRISGEVFKLLVSAISNAENNHGLDIDNLFVAEASVGKAIVMKRSHARGRGRSGKIMKPFSHMNIVVKEVKGIA